MSTPQLWQVIQRWLDGQVIRVNQSQLADAIGVGRQTVSQWKSGETRPSPENMRRLHEVTRIPFDDLTAALLLDMGYTERREDVGNDERSAPTSEAEESPVSIDELRHRQEVADTAPLDYIEQQAADRKDEE